MRRGASPSANEANELTEKNNIFSSSEKFAVRTQTLNLKWCPETFGGLDILCR